MIVKTSFDMEDARKEYEKIRNGGNSVQLSSPKVISGNIDNLLNSPAVDRLVQALTKLYIETNGMR